MSVSSTIPFTDPIREFKENDPYFCDVDNIPIAQVQNNTKHLKERLDQLTADGGISRSGFSELKPYVNGIDNIVRVKPGRYIARVNNAYGKTPMQKLQLLNSVIGGDIRRYTSVFALSSYNDIVSKLYSDSGASSLGMNGLVERIHTWRVGSPDQSVPTVFAQNNLPTTGDNLSVDKSPVVWSASFWRGFTQIAGSYTDLTRLSSEFVKQWRGIVRTAVVDASEEMSITIPGFDVNDFKRQDSTGLVVENIPNAATRIDLVFIYSHPVDESSTSIISYNSGQARSINKPTLGLVKGAGALFQNAGGSNLESVITRSIAPDGTLQILANVADQYNSDLGFKDLNVQGSFPSPEDLLNITPNLVETIESTDVQLIGQSILPVCYVVVRKTANNNSAGEVVLTDTDIIDIRPFFRTTELSYNERAGIAAATPPLHFGNPAVGQAQLDQELAELKSVIINQLQVVQESTPRPVAGGIIWGGTKYGPEGAVRLAASLLNGINTANLPFSDAPEYPDWDLADWWQLYASFGANAGSRRNDRINLQRKRVNQPFDSGTDPTDANDITTAMRYIGTQHFGGSTSNPYCIYWAKKEILIDRSAVPWMSDYTVECEFLNCIPQTHKSSFSQNNAHEDESGSAGIWVEKKMDRFIIYVGWMADSPDPWTQDGNLQHGAEPRLDRDTFGFSGFVVRHSDMGLSQSENIGYNATLSAKGPNIGVCTYPTVSFKVTGFPSNHFYKSLAQAPQIALVALK